MTIHAVTTRKLRSWAACISAGLLLAGTAWAQSPTTRPAGTQSPSREPEYTAAERVPNRLLDGDMSEGILLPTLPGEKPAPAAPLTGRAAALAGTKQKLLPDGYMVGRRPGRVEREDDGLHLVLDHVDGLPDAPIMRVLPNTRLTLLEAILADSSQERHFVVTGRVTEFKGTNYILLDNLAEQSATEDVRPAPAEDMAAPEPPPATKPSAEPATRPSGHEPTADELIHQLMRDKPTRTLILPPEVQSAATATAPSTSQPAGAKVNMAERTHWPDETMLSDYQARLVPGEAGVWMLAFEDPGKKPTLRPIRILPSKLLETALSLTTGGTKATVLVVSGEVTAHRGTNYILLRKVLVRRSMGNLR